LTKMDRMIIAHGILCTIGFLFVLPLGGLVARYFRTSTSAWFKAHQTIQSILAGPVILVGFALGVAVVATNGIPHFFDTHTRFGLALFLLYIVQIIIGNIIHRYKPKSAARRRPFQNYFHVFLGILIIALAFYQVRTGYKDEWSLATGRDPLPKAADIVFYIWAVIIPVLYFAGLALLPKQFKQEAASRASKATNHGRPSHDRTTPGRPSHDMTNYGRTTYDRPVIYERHTYERPNYERPNYEVGDNHRSNSTRNNHRSNSTRDHYRSNTRESNRSNGGTRDNYRGT